MISPKILIRIVCIVVLGFFITNCSVTSTRKEPQHTATGVGTQPFTTPEPPNAILITNLPTISVEPTPTILTSTQLVTKTVQPAISIEQHTTTPTHTSTLPPTPDTQTQENIWREIMTTPISSLPYWWGIEPGITSWTEAKGLLSTLAIYPDSYPLPDGIITHGASFHFFDLDLFNLLSFVEKKDIIESIQVSGQGLKNPVDFRKLWKEYVPEVILKEYSYPSRILLQTWLHYLQPSDPTYKYYELVLFYDQLGFVIIYNGRIENIPNYTVCPTLSGNLLEELYIFAQSPNSKLPLDNLIGDHGGPRESAYSLQEAAGLSIQQFYDLITKNQEFTCFDTQPFIWPK
jgi:hypothetical protein